MIIDFHTHIFPSLFRDKRGLFFNDEPDFELLYREESSKMAGIDDLINAMDKDKVDMSVVFGFPWKSADNFRCNNDYIIEAVQKHPDRLIGFSCFDPLSPDGAEEAERCFREGLRGVGELAIYDSPMTDDIISKMSDVMALCLEKDAPLLIHTNEPVGHQYPGKQDMTLKQIESLIKTYPDNKIILAHWGGGIFFYMLLKKEVKEAFENVWFDTAASPYLYNSGIYKTAGEIIGFDKILFGTDYPLIRPERYYNEIESSGIEPEAVDMIMGKNAVNLLGI
ncbi:amidohydrolase family protein [Thermodesulfobacteriota bacterium]